MDTSPALDGPDPIAPFVSSPTDRVFALRGLPEEVIAVLFAAYSRSTEPLRDVLRRAVLDGDAQDVSGLGDGAFLVLGPLKGGGGESIQAQGGILDGDQIYLVGITQLGGAAVTEDAVKAQAEAGMKLVDSKL